MTSLPNTAAEALENAARLSGNPHNAREVGALTRHALVLSGRNPDGQSEAANELVEKARADRAEFESAWKALPTVPFNRNAAKRARLARKAARA